MVFEFGNQLGWFAFFVLIPLIIIYLIRPKPIVLKVPSLMFFIKRSSVKVTESLFRRFQNELIFLVQLLILLFLAFSATEPSLTLNRDVVSGNIVFVLDVSASSQVLEGDKTRLEIAKEKIKDLATSRNSLVLLRSSPVIALQNVRRSELVRYLDRVQTTDEPSDIASAIVVAGEMLGENKGRVVIASDFIESKGVDADLAKNIFESRGIGVDFVDTKTSERRKNIGFVDMVISGEEVNLYLKNYNNQQENVVYSVNDETNNIDLSAGAVEPLVFSIENNLTRIKILNEDDFSVDNNVVITRPYPDSIKILWITNKPSKFLDAAFESIEGVAVTVAEPPIIPEGDFDVYVISDLDQNKLAFDNIGSVYRKVRDKGRSAVVVSQQESNSIDYENLLSFEFGELSDGGLVEINQINSFTKDADFGFVDRVFSLNAGNNIASVGNNTLISMFDVGNGNVLYYGIMESQSDFELTPSYPVFWNNLIYSFVGRGDLNNVNIKTGYRVEAGNETKYLDKVGVYQLGKFSVAANLLNEQESNINFVDTTSSAEYSGDRLESIKGDVDYRLDLYLVLVSLLLVLFEFIYIKFRGEI